MRRASDRNGVARVIAGVLESPVLLGVALMALIALLAFAAYAANQRLAAQQYHATDSNSLIARPLQSSDHLITGTPSSPVTIIVYSDLSCEYCRNFFKNTLPMLRQKYGSSFMTIYRHLPLASYPQSVPEAAASECVSKYLGESAFQRYVGDIYSDPGYAGGLSTTTLADMAVRAGADRAPFIACMADPAIIGRINTDAREAAVAGLTIAPSFVVKSSDRALTVSGNSYSRLDAAVSYLLEAQR